MTLTDSGKTKPGIPVPSLRRLPGYHQYLKQKKEEKVQFVSATAIAKELNLVPIQVRKDLAYTGIIGKPKLGYPTLDLIQIIEEFLGWNNTKRAFLAGAGDLGRAIIKYEGFEELGLELIAAFDTNPSITGTTIGKIKILPLAQMISLVKRMNVNVGIITAPKEAAQEIADEMVNAGIRGIWNFAPVKLKVPETIIVQNVNLAASLAVLCKQLSVELSG